MKSKKFLVILSIIGCLTFFTACTAERAEELQSEGDSIELSSEESSISFEEDTGDEDEASPSEAENSNGASASEPSAPPNFSSNENSSKEVLESEQELKPELKVVVQKASLLGSEEKVIMDETQIEQIFTYINGMFRSDYDEPPNTGGEIITVVITRNNNIEKYTFLETEVDGYRLAKNSQDPDVENTWYFSEPDAYQYLDDLLQD